MYLPARSKYSGNSPWDAHRCLQSKTVSLDVCQSIVDRLEDGGHPVLTMRTGHPQDTWASFLSPTVAFLSRMPSHPRSISRRALVPPHMVLSLTIVLLLLACPVQRF